MPLPDRPTGMTILTSPVIWTIRCMDGLLMLWINPDTGQILGNSRTSYN